MYQHKTKLFTTNSTKRACIRKQNFKKTQQFQRAHAISSNYIHKHHQYCLSDESTPTVNQRSPLRDLLTVSSLFPLLHTVPNQADKSYYIYCYHCRLWVPWTTVLRWNWSQDFEFRGRYVRRMRWVSCVADCLCSCIGCWCAFVRWIFWDIVMSSGIGLFVFWLYQVKQLIVLLNSSRASLAFRVRFNCTTKRVKSPQNR